MAKKARKSSFRGKVAADTKRQKTAGANFGYLKLPKGMNVYSPVPGAREKIDVIPYVVTDEKHPDRNDEYGIALSGDLWYKRPFRVHRNVGADNDSVVCLQSFGKKCPICEYRKQRAAEGADKDELKAFNSTLRNLYYIIPRGVKKREEEIHIFDMSQFLFQNLLNDEIEEESDYEVFPDIEEGLTLQVRWAENTFAGNKFAEASRIDFKKREEAISEDVLEGLVSLDEILKQLSYEELHAKFFEIDHEAEVDEDEDEKPSKKKTSKKEVDDEDDEEIDDADDGRATMKIKKSDVRAAKKSVKKEEAELTWQDLADMDEEELSEVIEEKELDIDVDDYEGEDDLRVAVAEELEIEKPAKKKPAKKQSKKEPEPEPEEDEEDEEDEDEKPAKKKTAKKAGKGAKDECPSGHEWGTDNDEHEECEDCELWDRCYDAIKKGGK